jgi:CubicO group peptidase (beta-lactamase class C family)
MPLFPSHPLARLALAVCFLLTIAGAGLARADDSPAAIQKILQERVDLGKKTPGIVVGIVDEHGTRVSAYGKMAEGGAPVDANTVFEIGSATKVFTATLLADMVRKGDVALSDPVAKYLPATVTVPSRGGKQITLLDLATHMSGLPRMPTNHTPADKANPHADYTVAQLYAFLSATQLERDIGEKYEYSNLGVALLGHALALRAGTDYITLVRERILKPLGMHDTAIVLSADQQRRFATGHNRQLGKVPAQDFPTLAPAGALRSTANDMLKFVAANLGMNGVEAGLYAAMQDAQKPRLPAGQPTLQIGLNWLTHQAARTAARSSGTTAATAGFHSFVGMNQASRKRRGGAVEFVQRYRRHRPPPAAGRLPAGEDGAAAGGGRAAGSDAGGIRGRLHAGRRHCHQYPAGGRQAAAAAAEPEAAGDAGERRDRVLPHRGRCEGAVRQGREGRRRVADAAPVRPRPGGDAAALNGVAGFNVRRWMRLAAPRCSTLRYPMAGEVHK